MSPVFTKNDNEEDWLRLKSTRAKPEMIVMHPLPRLRGQFVLKLWGLVC